MRLRSLRVLLSLPASHVQTITWECGYIGVRVGEATQPGPDSDEPFWLVLENEDGEPCNLRRSRVHSRNTWRWQAPPVKKHDPRRASVDRKDPIAALRNWQSRWATTLNEPSRMALEEACATAIPDPAASSQTILPTIDEEHEITHHEDATGLLGPVDQFHIPDKDTMTRIAELPIHELLHGPVTTQN